ncbi:bifunctional nuclease family protein [Corynebacterium cystitidis]|uniref:BFN domain-containing protein n=1 Tax=Corynebacterium cystitidis DSM 20524 TaxID=1121357 RepID=A0A1H9PTY1_9CORY|nr:bifunctional nuclease family protein [Corynebacterium cystitidis]WJY82380.1 hypothetical protein CCYS_07280 [Corynebacterium cystitidis DSM 20524]SER51736.1 hypothetical protein SAMN05661109_00461 [Corynebacterium cystitidis DSM 20524]SNV76088.1 Uncharacterised ACR, COG1259 [Corynebacterium cystitidis]
MTMVPLDFYGVHTIGPENFVCVLLHSRERDRIVPVWISPVEGARLAARQAEWEPDRPDTFDVLTSVITQCTSGATAVEINSYYEGIFVASLLMQDGEDIDCRVSDAVMIAQILNLPIAADETVVAQAGMWISHEDALEHFGVELPDPPTDDSLLGSSASGDTSADEEFADMMRKMGVDASDLAGERDTTRDDDIPETDGVSDTDVTQDDSDEI